MTKKSTCRVLLQPVRAELTALRGMPLGDLLFEQGVESLWRPRSFWSLITSRHPRHRKNFAGQQLFTSDGDYRQLTSGASPKEGFAVLRGKFTESRAPRREVINLPRFAVSGQEENLAVRLPPSRMPNTAIRDPDSVLGWTLANVLKRIELRNSQLEKLRKWASTGNRTVLWRIAHVLGRYPGKQNFATLLKLFDAKEWVRYGALRSLIGMVVVTTDTNFRDQVFKAISDRADAIFRDQRTLYEFCRAMFIQPSAAPADWGAHVLRIITKMYEKSETEQQLIRWQRLAASLRQQYSAAKAS